MNPSDVGIPVPQSDATRLVIRGETKEFFTGKLTNWVVLDPNTRKIVEWSYTLPLITNSSLPNTLPSDGLRTNLQAPEELAQQTTFYFLSLNILPFGHVPVGIYDAPHWEMHAVQVPFEEYQDVDCSDPTMPPKSAVPPDPAWYVLPPPNNCIPSMGIHAVNFGQPEFHQQKFTKSIVLVYYRGKQFSTEPKFTTEFANSRQPFEQDLPAAPTLMPNKVQPRKFKAIHDVATDTYVMTYYDWQPAPVYTK